MPLVERLMGLEEPKIHVHTFFAAAQEVIAGQITNAQVKTYLALDASGQAEYDAIAATAPTGTAALDIAQKALWLGRVHSVFLLAEAGSVPGYESPADIRARLGI